MMCIIYFDYDILKKRLTHLYINTIILYVNINVIIYFICQSN